jgi:peptidoglycan/LPS O-acetylase OafA/YrhL
VTQSSFKADSANLDLVRAVAVLCVFGAHLAEIAIGRRSELAWHFAQMGVLIFFVHTSMVLMLSLERARNEGAALFGSFYLRRFFRLYPLSVFCVTLAFVLSASPHTGELVRYWTPKELLSNLALTINLTYTDEMVGGLWTLPLEVQMYVALPFLYLACRDAPVRRVVALWLAAVALGMFQPHVSARLDVLSFAPCFVAGVLAWRLSRSTRRRLPGWVWPAAFAATWTVFLVATRDASMYYRWAFCLTLGLAIPWFQELRFQPLVQSTKLVAKYSYGIYLSHVGIMLFLFRRPLTAPARWSILAVLAILCPVAMYHLIEHPMIQAGQKAAARLFRRPVAPSASAASLVA